MNFPNNLGLAGRFTWELVRAGKVIRRGRMKNGVTTAGRNHCLDVTLRNQTQVATWYCGLVDNTSFSAFAAADTMGSHAGWIEDVDYTQANRVTITFAAASGALISNTASVAVFTINSNGVLKGIFVTSSNTKSGTTGTLWATGPFDSALTVSNTDTLNVTYECELQALV